ncbi:hypothetical protein ACK389_05525 [Streptomyces antibioticus]|uniref:hypothetical protein n=1 Tax=Streptomyces antibioticus TaxID=1890 RepID=UPI000AEB3E6D
MTNPNAFNAGTQQVNWWTNHIATAPEREAKRQAIETEQLRMIEEYRRQEAVNYASPAIVSAIQSYTVKGEMADTHQVESEFTQALPNAAPGLFRQVLDDLKAQGKVYEVQNAQGLMGMRSSHLYILEG